MLLASHVVLGGTQNKLRRVKFQPDVCEFYVYFPKEPILKNLGMETTTGQRVEVIRAEATLPAENCFLRAEFTPKLSNSLDNVGDQALIDAAHQFAKHDGWETPTVSIENSKLGKNVNVRGYKNVSGIYCTFESKTYYGENSVIILYAGGPSKSYPAPAIGRFFGSLGKSVAKPSPETTILEDNDFSVYRDGRYLFSAWYPKTWTTVPISHPQTRFKVRSENGFDDYSINVTSPASTKNMTPKEFVEMMNGSDPIELLRPYFPDAVLLNKGKSYLSNQDAFFYIYKGTFKAVGAETPVTIMQWQTIKYGYLYTLTCRAETERFESMLPVFQKILYGFVFQVNPNTSRIR
jgi:hypothetical protein